MEHRIPHHVAIIMDGNGRWAQARNLPRNLGHAKGIENVESIARHAKEVGVKVLSLFAFSTENWTRPQQEINFLFSRLKDYLLKHKKKLFKEGIRVTIMGRREGVPQELLCQLDEVVASVQNHKEFILNIAFNYGSRAEIIDAALKIASDINEGRIKKEITEEVFEKYLYCPFIPEVDLLIRTSGEKRISNFLLWRIAYAELYFTEAFWPDFTPFHLDKAIEEFNKRERRFGGIKPNA